MTTRPQRPDARGEISEPANATCVRCPSRPRFLITVVMLAVLGMACSGGKAPLPQPPPVADTATTSAASGSDSEGIDARPLQADREAQDGSNKAHRDPGVEGNDSSSTFEASVLSSTPAEERDSAPSQPINPAEAPDGEAEQTPDTKDPVAHGNSLMACLIPTPVRPVVRWRLWRLRRNSFLGDHILSPE